jgi:membrane protein DedA with SNARE-associated domain
VTAAALIEAHGYWMLAVGCFIEGEMSLALAAFAAHRGYLNPIGVFTVASAAAFASNQFFFWLGRRHGPALLARWPALAAHSSGIRRLIERHPSAAAIAVRFLYGTRIAGPILIGMSSMRQSWFAMLNGLSALAWTVLIGAAGWFFGKAAEHLLANVGQIEGWLLAALVLAVVAWRLGGRAAQRR